MATRFMRVDLSDEARDFRPIALEPGVPLLDRSGANAKILFRWLGGMVAEPVWEGDSVDFFARDDHGGRLEEVVCQPATAEDLRKVLPADVEKLKERIDNAKPETPTERMLKKTIRRSFEQLTSDPQRTDLDSFFFRYRDAGGRWRLVWCPGYRRVDQELAPAVVCTDPECTLLFVRRPGRSPKCPSCEAALATRPRRRRRFSRNALLVIFLLHALGAALFWFFSPYHLTADPETSTGPVGSRVEFNVFKTKWFSKTDVTQQAVGVVLDPAVARFDQAAMAVTLVGPGKTLIRFHLGKLTVDVPLIAAVARNPDKLLIEPEQVDLAIGTTARPKVFGEYEKEGTKVDLTDAVEWAAENDRIVYAYDGLLEGLSKGTTRLIARYRANAESDYVTAKADVRVDDVKLTDLELAIEPLPVNLGRASNLQIDALTKDKKKRYSILESSRLDTLVGPDYLAAVRGRHLHGESVGRGKLTATFDGRPTGQIEFDVAVGPGLDRLTVMPEQLDMVVGQITDLSIVSPSRAPIRMTSADPTLIEITEENRLIAKANGKTQVEVIQGNERRKVDVTVTTAQFASAQITPSRIVVPVDDTVRAKVLARIVGKKPRSVEIAPGFLTTEEKPSARYADFDPSTLALYGIWPTRGGSPQTLAMRFGKHGCSAPVEVIVAPSRLALTPPGPVELPLGQQMRLQGWATYSGGRRVQVTADRMAFDSDTPADAKPGLELRDNKVAALQAGAGPLKVSATYFGRESKPVTFTSVDADPAVKLRLKVDRNVRLVGETGQIRLTATGPKGDVDLVPEMAKFQSSDPAVLKIDEQTGAMRAVAPGRVTVTGEHAAAEQPASVGLIVGDPATAQLVFEPAEVHLAVDQVARLDLFLEVQQDGKTERAILSGPGVGYSVGQPDAIRWTPPMVVGLKPAGPFDLAASFYPHLSTPAVARIEVAKIVKPEALRIVPSNMKLAPDQSRPLIVQQQLPGKPDQWKEIRPDAITWTVPPELAWQPATDQLRPMVTGPADAGGKFELIAEYGGRRAMGLITMTPKGPDPNNPDAEVLLLREPPGEYLPVGGEQRYAIAARQGKKTEPAADIQWPDDFENEYVRWEAPVLTAKQPGYQQWLRAEVAGRTVIWQTTTYQPGPFDQPPPRDDLPVVVRILSDQTQPVRFPVGAKFDDFYVEAEYPDGFTRLVTKRATLRTAQPPESAPLTASEGYLIGVRPGSTAVEATYDGVRCEQPLQVVVTDALDVDQIRIAPTPVTILPGETVSLDVVGYKNGQSVGIITGLGNIVWRSVDPGVAQINGPAVTGVALGQTAVTAELDGLASVPADVHVVGSIAEGLSVDPAVVRLRVGQSAHIGTDVSIFRGAMDMSRQCRVTPSLPEVVQYNPATHSLVGRSPGASAVAFTLGNKLTNVMVEVLPGGEPIDGVVILEPASGNLAIGQALDMRVYVVTPDGFRIDRTDAAILTSTDPAKVAILGNLACAVGEGATEVTASLPGTINTGRAYVSVVNEPITELIAEPAQLNMLTGDIARLRILGRAASGTHLLFPQPDLTLTAAGQDPTAIQILGRTDVQAVHRGKADVTVGWRRGNLAQQIPVTVDDALLAGLQIEPSDAVIHPGQPLVYQVTGMRGGQRRVLGPADGVQLFVTDPAVAQPAGDLTIAANSPGRTTVVARVGNQQAEATLDVTPGSGPIGGEVLVTGPGGVTVYGPGAGYIGGDRTYWTDGHRYWDGERWIIGPDYVDGVYVAPSADVTALRFVPEVLRLATNSPATAVRVIEVLADGSDGRDVTADPSLELSQPPDTATIEKTELGPLVRPTGQLGETRIGAKLGNLMANSPLLVSVGQGIAGAARIVVSPNPLVLWPGETGTFSSVLVDPGGGQPLRPTAFMLIPATGQSVVGSTDAQTLYAQSLGSTPVVVSVTDPTTGAQLSTTATVQVIGADTLTIVPATVHLEVGQATPEFQVVAQPPGGMTYRVAAMLQSIDPNVLAPDPALPGRFVAQSFGETPVRAEYRGKEAFATVTVTGKRFLRVTAQRGDETPRDFDVTLDILADPAEGPLEYRVYQGNQAPGDTWQPAELRDGSLRVTLRSGRIARGPHGQSYHLILDARNSNDNSVQQFHYKFQLVSRVQETNDPVTTPGTNDPF